MAGNLTHNSSIGSSDTMNPPDLSSYQGWIPVEDESYHFIDLYNFSPRIPRISQEAPESPEKLEWTEPSFASDLLGSSLWSTASLPRETTDNRLSPLHECSEELPTVSNEKETHDEAVEDSDGKRSKRSTSADQQAADAEEQRRIGRIIRSLEQFENEQKIYGKQQLKAIKDGFA